MTSSDKDLSQRALNVLIYFWQDIPYIEVELSTGLLCFGEEVDELCTKGYLSRREKSDRFRNKRFFVVPTPAAQAMLSLLPPLSEPDWKELYDRWSDGPRPKLRRRLF